ncbi:MAG: hypothetical protein Q9209_005932 [Squamulea sp. 1 TL-2023]
MRLHHRPFQERAEEVYEYFERTRSLSKRASGSRLIIGAGPAGLMAALWMSRYGIQTRIIERREEHDRVGQADGIQIRSLEIFDSFGIVDRIWKESYHMVENPGDGGVLRRATRMSNTIPGMSRFPQGVLLAQHRVERIILDSLAEHSNIEIQRNVEPTSMAYDHGGVETHPITVEIAQVKGTGSLHPDAALEGNDAVKTNGEEHREKQNGLSKNQTTQEVIRAKYVIGCDGAHSWTRRQLGFQLEGEQSEYIWGVLGSSTPV